MSILKDYRNVSSYTISALKKAIEELESGAKIDTICPEILLSRAKELEVILNNIENDIL